jgi:hypothetical protein
VPVDSDVCVVRWVHLVNSAKRRGGERKEPSVGRTPTTFINLRWNAHACCGAVRRVEADLQGADWPSGCFARLTGRSGHDGGKSDELKARKVIDNVKDALS